MEKFEVADKSNRNVVYSCTYHVVWCPKYRRRAITHLFLPFDRTSLRASYFVSFCRQRNVVPLLTRDFS